MFSLDPGCSSWLRINIADDVEKIPDLTDLNPLMEGIGADDWLNSAFDDFGSYNWMET